MLTLRQLRSFCSNAPLILPREFKLRHSDIFNEQITPIKESWLYNFDTTLPVKLGLVQLHPRIFSAFPNPQMIATNVSWQQKYRTIDWLKMKTKAEFRTLNKKPWPQKGTGRARHGSRRTAQFTTGGWVNGPRGPKTGFFMVPFYTRVHGLISTLSVKFAQNDIKIVDTLTSFPSDDPKFLTDMMSTRGWGPSTLIVDTTDIFPKNIALSAHGVEYININDPKFLTDMMSTRGWGPSTLIVDTTDIFPKNIALSAHGVEYINCMPLYGLNVFSMLN
uniref:Large ribosomal subunit protein uL4m n=1 Tax=Tetranychus urticae TaxID=32264 RepID=T1K1M5_TETUR